MRAWARTLRRRMRARIQSLFESFVVHSDDRRLDRLAGSRRAQGLVFAQLARRFDPSGARGFNGELQFDLRRTDGRVNTWTIAVEEDRAVCRRGPATTPAVTISSDVADVVRMAAGEFGPASALLAGRLDLSGDWGVAMRLARMFSTPE